MILDTIQLPLWAIIALTFFYINVLLFLFEKMLTLSAGIYIMAVVIEAALTALYLTPIDIAWKIVLTAFSIFFVWMFIEIDKSEVFNESLYYEDYGDYIPDEQITDIADIQPEGKVNVVKTKDAIRWGNVRP